MVLIFLCVCNMHVLMDLAVVWFISRNHIARLVLRNYHLRITLFSVLDYWIWWRSVAVSSLVLRNEQFKKLWFHVCHFLQASKECTENIEEAGREDPWTGKQIVKISVLVRWKYQWHTLWSEAVKLLMFPMYHVLSASGTEASTIPHAVSRQDCTEKGCHHSCSRVCCWWPVHHFHWEQWQVLSFSFGDLLKSARQIYLICCRCMCPHCWQSYQLLLQEWRCFWKC